MLIKKLNWDSGFFHLSVGAVLPGTFDAAAFENEKSIFDLIYIFELPDNERIAAIEQYCAEPADIKITYKKYLSEETYISPEHISLYEEPEPDEQLISLSLQSGAYSRFKTDTYFPAGSFEKLYTEWIRRSIDKTLASEVLIYREPGQQITGFVTLQEKGAEMHIGLIAVDASARGKGIGQNLVRAAEQHAQRANFLSLSVSTQSANEGACRLYEKCGFTKNETAHIYHYWKV